MELVKEIINGRDGKTVFDCNKVDSTIIDTKSPSLVFISNKKNRGRVSSTTRVNHTIFDYLREILSISEFLKWG